MGPRRLLFGLSALTLGFALGVAFMWWWLPRSLAAGSERAEGSFVVGAWEDVSDLVPGYPRGNLRLNADGTYSHLAEEGRWRLEDSLVLLQSASGKTDTLHLSRDRGILSDNIPDGTTFKKLEHS
ncbi:MAG: hypothetical protein ACHQ50_01750 [Fimbriimonadales bacterium]